MARQLVKIVKAICKKYDIEYRSFSDDWIIQLRTSNSSKTMYIYGYRFPNNNAAIDRICSDKSALSDVLEANQIRHIRHYYYNFSGEQAADKSLIKKIRSLAGKKEEFKGGMVCKPNGGSGGRSVYRVFNDTEFAHNLDVAIRNILTVTKTIAISPYCEIENEYRVIIANGKVKLTYQKDRPHVIGNGENTIEELCTQAGFSNIQMDCNLSLSYKPALNERCDINWKHNLGQGSKPVTIADDILKKKIISLAQDCVACLNLEFASIDIVDVDNQLKILEINSGIMMETYSAESRKQYNIAMSIYEEAILHYLQMDNLKYKYAIKRPRIQHLVLPILKDIAEKKGIEIIQDEEEGNFSIFVFKNGKRFIAKDYPFNINSGGSIALCTNKSACSSFLRRMGFTVPEEVYFVKKSDVSITRREVEKCLNNPSSKGLSYPMIVKPNSLTQGIGVSKINTPEEGLVAVNSVLCLTDKIFLLQNFYPGRDFRIVVLGNKVIQAYERIPFHIKGDGKRTIKELLIKKIKGFRQYRDKAVNIDDPRIVSKVRSQNYTMDTILAKGQICYLQDIANLSLGGTTRECTKTISVFFQDLAIQVASCLNLKLCGIDIIADNIEDPKETNYCILEVNSAPGLDNYAFEGKEQKDYVYGLYEQILEYIETM